LFHIEPEEPARWSGPQPFVRKRWRGWPHRLRGGAGPRIRRRRSRASGNA